MRIAVISDIHANLWALEAVVADAIEQGVEAVWQLGDVLYGPLAPQATYTYLQQLSVPITHIKGNQDDDILKAERDGAQSATMQYVLDDLSAEALAWLASLPDNATPLTDVFCCHGTPNSNTDYWLENIASGEAVLKSDAEITALSQQRPETLLLCGHTHTPRHVWLSTGQTIVNPGSVGLPAYSDELPVPHRMQSYHPAANYALVTRHAQQWHVAHRRVPYDCQAAAAQARRLQRLDWETALLTGRSNT